MHGNVIDLGDKGGTRERIRSAKWAYTTRRVPAERAHTLVQGGAVPRVGDLVLAKVRRTGQHKRLELANGRRAALAGRVSMDMIGIDLRGHPEARVGDPVTLWGEGLPVDEVASAAGTISYELFCGVNRRVLFDYVE